MSISWMLVGQIILMWFIAIWGIYILVDRICKCKEHGHKSQCVVADYCTRAERNRKVDIPEPMIDDGK